MNVAETIQTPGADKEQQTTQDLAQILVQLSKPEVQQSLVALMDNLPRLTEAAGKLADLYTLLNTLANDPVFVNDVKGGFNEMVMPVVDGAKGIASAAIEAKDRAETETDKIGVFGLLKMMNDPQAQKMFRFLRAFLAVTNERENAR
ncbi:DUF1641 domain-containing protein [Paenibacillus sambharensis]|uniref:DUF1641 domain-containing protein n=1 Tax=Paenibacillus sambharensis TaxID=1803190 RepID=A0A2W1M0N6_9BACL|nr:DUF1641 domain-containing protein [Paenibacillus sambharensis]PZD97491.1 DUF1641 domain-containing protein [Paenibacillus sambharensis]